MNRGPAVIGATQFAGLTGAKGEGVKVAVVDDGVDHEHAFLGAAGLSYPAGFPKGPGGSTTPKVIVARGFAGPGANSAPLDREQSFHGTFVAGVIAGVEGTDVPAGRPGFCSEASGGCHPAVQDLSGVAPRAHIGNYRVFNVPLPLGGLLLGHDPGDRRRVRGRRHGRHGRHQLLRRRAAGRPADGRDDAGGRERRPRRRRADHLRRQRPRLLRARHERVARNGAGGDQPWGRPRTRTSSTPR